MRQSRASFGLGVILVSALAVLGATPIGRTLALPATYQLFGPVQADGKEENTYGTTYVFIVMR